MSGKKSLLLSVAICIASASVAQADPMLSNNDGSWSFWSSTGNSVVPTTMDAARSAAPASTPEPAPAPAAAPVVSHFADVQAAATLATQSSPPSTPAPTPTPIPPGGRADAYINFGAGPYPEQSLLTTGDARPWYTSPTVTKYFGGAEPNAQQQADFTNAVLSDVQQTFKLSGGLAPKLTLDPSIPTNHTMSVVAGASYPANDQAVGITSVGSNGFSFIDKLSYGSSLEQLEWSVAHNVAHELMHAFGVSGHDDETGHYLDAAVASWEMLTDPNTRFSDTAIADMRARNFGPNSGSGTAGALLLEGDMEILATPVPEPATWALWGLVGAAALIEARRRQRRAAA